MGAGVGVRPGGVGWGGAGGGGGEAGPAGGGAWGVGNYGAQGRVGPRPAAGVLEVGGEGGGGPADRAALRAHGFRLRHLGPRVLRTETACVAGISVLGALEGA